MHFLLLTEVSVCRMPLRGFVLIKSCGATLSDVAREYRIFWIQTGVYCLLVALVYRRQIIRVRRKMSTVDTTRL